MSSLFEPERTTRTWKLGPPDPKRENTLRHLANGWIPAHPAHLSALKEALRAETIDRAAIEKEIKSDPGLFVFAARSVKESTETGGIDVFASLRTLEDEKLKKLFDIPEAAISPHNIEELSRAQALRQQFSLLSASAAGKLAEKASISPDLAFSAASFRQLGMNLVAWNYPRIYARFALSPRRDPADAEREIEKLLGITPSEIGARFAAAWGMHPSVRSAIGPVARGRAENADLARILYVSELFAQRKDPQHFPNAESIWRDERTSIEAQFPKETFEEIEADVKSALGVFSSVNATLFSLPPARLDDGAESAETERANRLAAENTHLARCPEEIAALLRPVYERMSETAVSVDALRVLVDHVTPKLGFERGCLFLAAANERTILPALRFGDRLLGEYTDFLSDPDCGVQASLHGSAPFKGEGIGVTGTHVFHLSSSLDNADRLGILYFELAAGREEQSDAMVLLFKVVRFALNQCLRAGSQQN